MLHTGCSTKEASNITVSFVEHLKFQEKLPFAEMPFGLIVGNQNQKNQNEDTIHFEIATYKVIHERSNKTAPFAEHLKFQEKLTSVDALSVESDKLK